MTGSVRTRLIQITVFNAFMAAVDVAGHFYLPLFLPAGVLFSLLLLVPTTAPAPPECDCWRHQVPVRLATGEHAANLCTECGRQVYLVSWVYRGE